MKHIIFLSLFFCFASFSAMAYTDAPSKAFETSSDDLFGSQSSGSGTFDTASGGGTYSASSNSSNNNAGGGSLGGLFDWFARQTSSSYSSPLQRAIEDGGGLGSLDPQDGGEAGGENDEDYYNDVPAGDGIAILLAFSFVYLAFAYRKKRREA